jgi:hypothetical protein
MYPNLFIGQVLGRTRLLQLSIQKLPHSSYNSFGRHFFGGFIVALGVVISVYLFGEYLESAKSGGLVVFLLFASLSQSMARTQSQA